ncbi:cell envelope integrity protein CreD [Pseudomonas gingeri]|uniref:cell envelope integrity protein CreD n=1 Tax=Pseudomonas gingeri TaxID=117681 RepID=UPI0015A42D66|nr:cell envelope integrity protein CreD [Pseudomonas gingeri]NWA01950.1 cell envelope integrity protein CreD [Pseudomonas gingeri]NWA17958.1 cell envelope integrity protein CreD [Pseudomonas gingeri]NWA53387.1 cell envelope integrity protein CreD [Pseudomonas gingeri]NWA95300.1 cell envelope integrity protein CreD [Pseudomonas gingeri]NWB00252.1 cell envelope integrity protein CreD [Pseudomonas gingeri]
MNRSLAIKLGAIALLMLLLLIPLIMIDGMIDERQNLRDGVLEDIARSSSYSQLLSGPVLVVPYRQTVREWKTDAKGDRFQQTSETSGRLYFLPERFELDGKVQTELRSRGIYEARLFHASNHISGTFALPAQLGISEDFADYRFDEPYLAVGISDIRGIENALTLQLGSQQLEFLPGTQVSWLGDGVHVTLPRVDGREEKRLDFAFDLALQGTGQLQVMPVGKTSTVHLSADWPHPSFIGNYLPTQREINDQGFSANWQTSFFSTNLHEALNQCLETTRCEAFKARSFGVSFIEPVDQYLKSDRAIKYALLFIALTFAGFFLFEVLKRLAVHPIQYALVGAALAFFYLLLLSLSEHLGFGLAYVLSAGACVGLIGFYVCHVLRSLSHGLGFAAALAALYGLLYGLLSAEDYALLMGSLLLFGLLGVFMVLTRKLDWYGIGQARSAVALKSDSEAVHG